MMKSKIIAALAAFVLLFQAADALAAVQIVSGSGKLLGATGVIVNGQSYNVTFIDGTCIAVFGGCDSTADFDFSASDGAAAAAALLAQVFQDTPAGAFSTFPGLTYGCGIQLTCSGLIPVGFDDFGSLNIFAAQNTEIPGLDSVVYGQTTPAVDYTNNDYGVFAKFSLSSVSAAPEPATWGMMLFGFAAVGAALRRRGSAGLKAIG